MYYKIRKGDSNQRGSMPPILRTCHLKRSCEYKEYGFYLYQEETNPDQIVGIVDEGSSADKAGLRVEDKILKVNDIDANNKTHTEVIELMKTNPLEIKLLVVNRVAEEQYEEQKKNEKDCNKQNRSSTSSCEDMLLNGNKD